MIWAYNLEKEFFNKEDLDIKSILNTISLSISIIRILRL